MSKRNMEGDVLANRLSLGLAKHQKLLSSWMGTQPDAQPSNDTAKIEEEDHELHQGSFGHDRLGVGGIVPKDIADGSFTRRTITSNDKLLEQLIGKKKAKAHMAAKLHAERSGAVQPQPKNSRQATTKKEESDDEEEGRAATFKSKRRKIAKPKPAPVSDEEADDLEQTSKPPVQDELPADSSVPENSEEAPTRKFYDEVELEPAPKKSKSIPSRSRAKPTSYLDELLAERSKKKQNKAKNKTAAES